ncbi:tellurite resistance TerB family protein [Roseibium sp. RKSG952]|uniref:tellurite resistance TerB family protein n=1 Tax=Roseibium sp. RKSG952 TaxID=2529384 RepID=UPI0012BD7F13|nr:tellurite resistance TerB family protein [Roseibium sp. RKSG952]MTI00246.1 Tellurite resistance protein TerB [Roseibium sp. RKSG952]
MKDALSIQEALVYVMVIMSAADNKMTDAELSSIGEMVKTLPVFTAYNDNDVLPAAQRCGDILQESNGLDSLLELIANTIPKRLYDTAYALAVDVAAADLDLRQEELRLLQMLRDRFDLDKLTVAAIERAAQARHRTL